MRKVAARVLSVSGMSDQASYAVSLSRRWLGMGATEATIIAAIQEHQAAIRANGEEPRRLKVFEAAVLRGMEAQQIVETVPRSVMNRLNRRFPENPCRARKNACSVSFFHPYNMGRNSRSNMP